MNKILVSSFILSSILLGSPNEIGYDKSKEIKVKNGLYEFNNIYRFKKGDLIEIFYSKKFKGAVMIKYRINKNANKNNPIKKRPNFYTEKILPVKYRSKNSDYIKSGFDK